MMSLLFILFYVATCRGLTDFAERPGNFSIDLLHHTELQKYHAVLSPFGMWTLMGTIALGATRNSYSQLSRALYLPNSKLMFVKGYKLLADVVLNPQPASGVTMTSANFIFFDNGFSIRDKFARRMEKNFNATVKALDFQDPDSVDNANKIIKNLTTNDNDVLIPEDFEQAKMVLTNVIHFKGLWSSPFDASKTREEPFYDESKNVIGQVNMMFQKTALPCTNVETLKCFALEMPYGISQNYSMLFLLPHPLTKLSDAYEKLNGFTIKDIFSQMEEDYEEFGMEEVDIKIPRFKITTNIVMNSVLNDMGVQDIFKPDLAHLEEMSDEGIFVSSVVQKAEILVTESGTIGSAISEGVIADRISAPTFHANRPFFFFLVEKSSLTTIFSGVYSEPSLD